MYAVGVRATLWIMGASLLFPASSTLCAAQSAALTPVQVVEKFLAATGAENWKGAAQYLDMEPIEKMRRDLLRMGRDTAIGPHVTPEEIMKHDPEMPRAVAEYQVKQAEKARTSFDPIRFEFADVKDREALTRLTPHELAIRWVKAQSLRYRMELATAMSPECPAIPSREVPKEPHSIVGVVKRGSRAYVVDVRAGPEAEYEPPPTVFELRRLGGQWKLLPPRESGGIAVSCDLTDKTDSTAKK